LIGDASVEVVVFDCIADVYLSLVFDMVYDICHIVMPHISRTESYSVEKRVSVLRQYEFGVGVVLAYQTALVVEVG